VWICCWNVACIFAHTFGSRMIFVSFVFNCLLISLRMKNIFSLSLLQFPKLSKKTQNFSDVHTLAHAYFIFASRAVLLKSKRRCIKENPDTITVNTHKHTHTRARNTPTFCPTTFSSSTAKEFHPTECQLAVIPQGSKRKTRTPKKCYPAKKRLFLSHYMSCITK
jgi:hypothetical protein